MKVPLVNLYYIMFSIYWAKLGFDSGNAAGAKFVYEVIIPINEFYLICPMSLTYCNQQFIYIFLETIL